MDFKEYLEITYASWLAKIIGIRLGSSIEAFSHEEIKNTYGFVDYYPVDYGIYAADDDSNGPRFFVDALRDTRDKPLISKMEDNLLNKVRENKGFFWWGGDGISTEHTAYLRLKEGKRGGLSGSYKTNGKIMANQIGGQIFSDCWGYVALGDPEKAKELATCMASITHDLEGVEGAKFVACAIAIAYKENDIYRIIDKALTYLDKKSDYYRVVNEIRDFYYKNPSDYKACLDYILKNHSYEVYGGLCPIISNAALMVMAMLYGENKFDLTMSILATAGWDTDCNLGNVGSILGAMLKLDGIDDKWTRPINDLILFSSSLPYMNIDTISNTSLYFANLAYKYNKSPIPKDYEIDESRAIFNFKLPRATQAFNIVSDSYRECNLKNEDGSLKVIINSGKKYYETFIYKRTYFNQDDLYDYRYDPVFTPTIYKGETITFNIVNKLDIDIHIYVKDMEDKIYLGRKNSLTYNISKVKGIIKEFGLKIKFRSNIRSGSFLIKDVSISRSYDYKLDFTKESIEDWGYNFIGDRVYNLSQLSISYGEATYDKGLLLDGMVIFSDSYASLKNMEVVFKKEPNKDICFLYDVQGINIYKAIKISSNKISYINRNNDDIKEYILDEFARLKKTKFSLNIDTKYGKITLTNNRQVISQVTSIHIESDYGALGIISTSKKAKVFSMDLSAN